MSLIDMDFKKRRIEDEFPSKSELICSFVYFLAVAVIVYVLFFEVR